MESTVIILSIVVVILGVIVGFLVDRLYWSTKLFSSFFINNQKSNVMEEETNVFKQIVGFLFSLLAGWLGYAEAPELVMSFGAILASVYVIVDLVKKYVSSPWVQIVSWVTGIILSLGGWYLELGIFVDMTWVFALVTGFIISLAANGVYDSGWLESAWELIRNLFKKK